MLPVVRGEGRTKFEMLAYTLILLPLTIMPALFGARDSLSYDEVVSSYGQ